MLGFSKAVVDARGNQTTRKTGRLSLKDNRIHNRGAYGSLCWFVKHPIQRSVNSPTIARLDVHSEQLVNRYGFCLVNLSPQLLFDLSASYRAISHSACVPSLEIDNGSFLMLNWDGLNIHWWCVGRLVDSEHAGDRNPIPDGG